MLKHLIILLMLWLPLSVSGRMESSPIELWELPFQSKELKIRVVAVEGDINLACNEANKKAGRGNFRDFTIGCAYWSLNKEPRVCLILLSKHTNNDILGHELRHCLVGSFHED